jgi:hypothetical protein
MSGPSRNHPLPLSLLLLLPSIGVHGLFLSTTTSPLSLWARSSGIPALSSRISTCLASSIAMPATTTSISSHQQPLAIHGDWQAFFDEDRYCLMYYFNTKTGDSQWEPPDDFPIPMLDSHAASPFTAGAMPSHYNIFADPAKQKNLVATTTTTFSAGGGVVTAQKKQAPIKKQQQVPTPAVKQQQQQPDPDVAAVFFKAAFGFAATMAGKAAEAVVDHVKKQQQQQQQQEQQQKSVAVQKEQENKPWWLSFFHQDKPNQKPEEPIGSRRLGTSTTSSSNSSSRRSHLDVIDLLSEVNLKLQPSQRTSVSPPGTMASSSFHHQPSHQQASTNTAAKKQAAFWSTWNNNNNHHAAEPTIPLVPPLQREQWLQEKLYADSLKRQENLRKSYRKVIENRSPTISLSALKRDHKKDWYQYLNDDV